MTAFLAVWNVLSLAAPPADNAGPLPDPRWEVAFERKGDIWMADAAGKHLQRLVKKAENPHWSRDGKKLAFTRGSNVWVLNLATHKERLVTRFERREPGSENKPVYLDWDPSRPVLLCATLNSNAVRMVQYTSAHQPVDILAGILQMPTFAPSWSPSGKHLAFVRAGDVWIASRYVSSPADSRASKPKGSVESKAYYEDARRLAPLAMFNDNEIGVSLVTPYWVDELTWTRDEKRLVFHFRRIGGSGVAQIGYLDLDPIPKSEDKDVDWAEWSGFRVEAHWILDDVWSPRLCPDGKTLSYTGFDEGQTPILYLNAWDGKHERKLFSDVWHPDWRPR